MSNGVQLTAATLVLALWPSLAQAAECIRLDFEPSPLARVLAEARDRQITLTCPRGLTRPEIDGDLDDEAWQAARTLKTVGMPTAPTSARICFDDRAIYIAVKCTEKPGRTPRGEARARDGELWGDDHVEIWLTPPGAKMTRYQFVVSIAGSIFDLKDGRTGYDPAWTHAARREDDGWVLEAAIPYHALELAGPVGRLGFNVGRNGPGLTLQCWNGTYGDTSKSVILLDGIEERGEQATSAGAEGTGQVATSGSGLNVHLERAYARPGERWIEAEVSLQSSVDLGSARLRAKLFELAGETPIATTSIEPPRRDGRLLVDLRSKALTDAEVSVELLDKGRRIGAAKLLLSAQPCAIPFEPGDRARTLIDVPSGMGHVRSWPVTFGVPFPPGALWDAAKLRAVGRDGKLIPFQAETTGLWAREGAVKWARVDALVSSEKGCFIEALDDAEQTRPVTPLSVGEQGDTIVIETGASRYVLGKGPSPIREIRRGGRLVATSSGTKGLYVTDQHSRVASASADGETARIEARGPVAACVRFEGPYRTTDGETLARHITRVECFAGAPSAKVTHTLVITNDTYKVWFKDVGWELAVTPGSDAVAAFAASRSDWQKVTSRSVRDANAVYMLQERHYAFAHGESHFTIAAVGADGQEQALAEGEECGDWGLLSGRGGGLAMGCREAARQHPTEFEVRQDRVTLHLFSGRAGGELDFRPATLVKKWDLETWQSKATGEAGQIEDLAKKAAEYQVSAVGWAKTHELCFLPLLPSDSIQNVARTMKLHSDPVYAHVDPKWIWKTGVLGPLHPRDPQKFPHAEQAIDAVLELWMERVPSFGEYGFIDYYAGPHLAYRGSKSWYRGTMYPILYRYALTYALRPHLWLAYARSASREIREFARETNRVYMDSYLAHWDGPKKTRGHYCVAESNESHGGSPSALPFYWGTATRAMRSSSTDLNQFIWLYHLCGYRRGRDCMLEYIDGIKRAWTAATPKNQWRVIMLLRTLSQLYTLTWDPEIRAMADATGDFLYDPEGALGLTKERPYQNSLWKTWVDVAALLEAWETFGQKRYHDAALRVSRFWWDHRVGAWPVSYVNHAGLVASFLYRETADPSIPERLKAQIRQACTVYDPETMQLHPRQRIGRSAEQVTFFLQSIPYAEDVIIRSGALGRNLVSWVGFDDYSSEASAVFMKSDTGGVEIDVYAGKSTSDSTISERGKRLWITREAGGTVRLEPLKRTPAHNHGVTSMNYVCEKGDGSALVCVPKDAPDATYRLLRRPTEGEFFAFCHTKTPMVVHAPSYWVPLPRRQRPALRIYFKVPEQATDAQVFFEGSARLYDPDGTAHRDAVPQHGWVDLPAGKPGLWSFEPVDNRLVRVRNLPPFFAFCDAANYFEPDLPWSREEIPPPPETVNAATAFVAGAQPTPSNQALYLARSKAFSFAAGEAHPRGNGSQFLPFEEGTIEFFFKPNWGTFDAPAPTMRLMTLASERDPWFMEYRNHSLSFRAYSDGPSKRITFGCGRSRLILDRDRWIHIAAVWGQRARFGRKVLKMDLYIDGKLRNTSHFPNRPNAPADRPTAFFFGRDDWAAPVQAAFDELRVSDVQRYTDDFEPPRIELDVDVHTRALFHFNGSVEGKSYEHGRVLLVGPNGTSPARSPGE